MLFSKATFTCANLQCLTKVCIHVHISTHLCVWNHIGTHICKQINLCTHLVCDNGKILKIENVWRSLMKMHIRGKLLFLLLICLNFEVMARRRKFLTHRKDCCNIKGRLKLFYSWCGRMERERDSERELYRTYSFQTESVNDTY